MNLIFPEASPVIGSDGASIGSLEKIYAPITCIDGDHWRANMVASLNGSIEKNGRSAGLSTDADRKVFSIIRAFSDAVVIGTNTAIIEEYTSLPQTPDALMHLRRINTSPQLVVVGRDLNKIRDSKLIESKDQITLVTSNSQKSQCAGLLRTFLVEPQLLLLGEKEPDLNLLRKWLRQNNLIRITLEGGPSFLKLAFSHKLIDEIALTIVPKLEISSHGGFLGLGEQIPGSELELLSILEDHGTLLMRYRVIAS